MWLNTGCDWPPREFSYYDLEHVFDLICFTSIFFLLKKFVSTKKKLEHSYPGSDLQWEFTSK